MSSRTSLGRAALGLVLHWSTRRKRYWTILLREPALREASLAGRYKIQFLAAQPLLDLAIATSAKVYQLARSFWLALYLWICLSWIACYRIRSASVGLNSSHSGDYLSGKMCSFERNLQQLFTSMLVSCLYRQMPLMRLHHRSSRSVGGGPGTLSGCCTIIPPTLPVKTCSNHTCPTLQLQRHQRIRSSLL